MAGRGLLQAAASESRLAGTAGTVAADGYGGGGERADAAWIPADPQERVARVGSPVPGDAAGQEHPQHHRADDGFVRRPCVRATAWRPGRTRCWATRCSVASAACRCTFGSAARPSSGAYIPDAADEVFSRGILPVTGEPYPHTFAQDTGFSTKLPTGWEQTAMMWKAVVYSVDDEEAGFRVGMDCRLRRQIGRSSHSISAEGYTGKSWWYENSWGDDWGDLGKSVGYDSRFYSGFVYQPVLRDEVEVLMARELPIVRSVRAASSPLEKAAKEFHDKMVEIKRQMEAKRGGKVACARQPAKF